MVKTILRKSSLLGFIIFLLSCEDNRVYNEYAAMPIEGWHADSIAHFTLDVQDTLSSYAVYLKLRHNHEYPWQNIWFFRSISSHQGIEYTDTINYVLANDMGKWLGKGIGDKKMVTMPLTSQALQFKHPGEYTFSIQHGMRDTVLSGVLELGLEVFSQNESTN